MATHRCGSAVPSTARFCPRCGAPCAPPTRARRDRSRGGSLPTVRATRSLAGVGVGALLLGLGFLTVLGTDVRPGILPDPPIPAPVAAAGAVELGPP
ncbi:MAG: zinc ribbon domain-containing protein, partial [Nitriliruptoraceae bacterium]|nr:zinc ribbon domain-containing protein [Nitriliruptoraceae bacterium]